MNFHQLTELIDEGEGLHIEFKRKVSSPERIAKEMIAFANTSGGVILFGIDDDRSTVGVESEKGEVEFIELAAREYVDPPLSIAISYFVIDEKDIVCVEVPESKIKPHFLMHASEQNGDDERKSYLRVGENSVLASKEMIKVMRYQSGDSEPLRLIIGEAEKRLFAFFELQDRITVKEYAHLINVSERRASRLLLRLVRAGVLAIHTLEKSDYFSLMRNGDS